jgi:hypothetical protein
VELGYGYVAKRGRARGGNELHGSNLPVTVSEAFRYDRQRLDDRLLAWVHDTYNRAVRDLDEIAGPPGFTPSELPNGTGRDAQFGPVTQELQALGYWLFISFGDPVIFHPAAGTHAKSVDIVRVNVNHSSPGRMYLRMDSTIGDHLEPILVPVPRLPDVVAGKAKTDFGGSREALHEAAIRLTDRVNLIWPAVTAMSALSRAVANAQD